MAGHAILQSNRANRAIRGDPERAETFTLFRALADDDAAPVEQDESVENIWFAFAEQSMTWRAYPFRKSLTYLVLQSFEGFQGGFKRAGAIHLRMTRTVITIHRRPLPFEKKEAELAVLVE